MSLWAVREPVACRIIRGETAPCGFLAVEGQATVIPSRFCYSFFLAMSSSIRDRGFSGTANLCDGGLCESLAFQP
jgi:hypothetical protein